jgi:hypothetical protein
MMLSALGIFAMLILLLIAMGILKIFQMLHKKRDEDLLYYY